MADGDQPEAPVTEETYVASVLAIFNTFMSRRDPDSARGVLSYLLAAQVMREMGTGAPVHPDHADEAIAVLGAAMQALREAFERRLALN